MCLSNWFLNVAYVFHKERAAYVAPILITCSHFTSRPRPGSQSKQEETVVLLGLNINLHDILLGYFPQHTLACFVTCLSACHKIYMFISQPLACLACLLDWVHKEPSHQLLIYLPLYIRLPACMPARGTKYRYRELTLS